MTMTVVVTRNVSPRFRGFLASVMLEIAPSVYTGPRMSAGVRERVWDVLSQWFEGGAVTGQGSDEVPSIVMTWLDKSAPGGQRIETLGIPAKSLVDAVGLFLVRRL